MLASGLKLIQISTFSRYFLDTIGSILKLIQISTFSRYVRGRR